LWKSLPEPYVRPARFRGKPTSLVVRESEPPVTNLLPQNAILLNEVLDDVLLPLIHPARNPNDQK
jgi:hypothetical protein